MTWPSAEDSDSFLNIVGITLSLPFNVKQPNWMWSWGTCLLFAHNTAEQKHCGWVWPCKRVKEQWSMMNPWTLPFLFRGGFKHMLQVVLTGLTSKSNQNAMLTFISVLSPASLDLHHCLLLATRNRSNRMVCASCFHLKPLFENRVMDRMWGKTQVPVSSPLNVPFMARHRWGSPKNPLHWCGRCEKKHNGRGQFTFEQWKVYKFRKPAWLDDMRHPLSRRLSRPSACGKSRHSIT